MKTEIEVQIHNIEKNTCKRVIQNTIWRLDARQAIGEGSSNITYDYKNSSIENSFLIKFQNFCWKHFLVTLYIFPVLSRRSRERKILEKSQITATYTHCIIYKFQLNPFLTAQEMDLLIISSLFSFIYLSNCITGEVANEKFWKIQSTITYTYYIIYKFQLNPFPITEAINFLQNF